jgi:hypothetical protein
MKLVLSIAALLVATSLTNAADLLLDAPVIVDAPASSGGLVGVVEFGALATHLDDTDGNNEGWIVGGYASAAVWGLGDSLIWGIDGYVDANNWDRDEDSDIPTYVGVLGSHLGFNTGSGSVGVFGSLGVMHDDNDDATARWGYAVGVEGIAEVSSGLSVFGQLGYADARPDEDADDEGFTGPFGRIGALYALNDDMAIMADLSAGTSDSYIDGDETGGFVGAGIKGAFRLPTDFDAFITAGYEFAHYSAEIDSSTGTTHTVKVGLSIPFGDDSTASTALNPLATSIQPYRAAGWANVLD